MKNIDLSMKNMKNGIVSRIQPGWRKLNAWMDAWMYGGGGHDGNDAADDDGDDDDE